MKGRRDTNRGVSSRQRFKAWRETEVRIDGRTDSADVVLGFR